MNVCQVSTQLTSLLMKPSVSSNAMEISQRNWLSPHKEWDSQMQNLLITSSDQRIEKEKERE